jgi:cellulose synthase/poly-beta-1,6-N-acetylglucosamine synthase-like glycosyltransferase
LVAIPAFTLAFQCFFACLGTRKPFATAGGERPACVLLVPAHNEEKVIVDTLAAMRGRIRHDDRVVVIADNCSDATAELVRETGFEVIERHDSTLRGKGYAMQFGIDSLRESTPQVVVFVDADCRLMPGAIDSLVTQAATTGKVVQANYRMRRSECEDVRPNAKAVISEFAVLIKNYVRPKGMAAVGVPCHLTGSGMAFPWTVAANLPFATDNIVEDMVLGCKLMIIGNGPLFCEDAEVVAPLPASDAAALEQRKRWEHGHMHTLIHQMPRMLIAAIQQRRLDLLGVAFDLTVPPLTLIALALAGSWLAAAIFCLINPWPFALLSAEIFAMGSMLTWAAVKFSDDKDLGAAIWSLPRYAIAKVPLYFTLLIKGRQKQWVRTSRESFNASNA